MLKRKFKSWISKQKIDGELICLNEEFTDSNSRYYDEIFTIYGNNQFAQLTLQFDDFVEIKLEVDRDGEEYELNYIFKFIKLVNKFNETIK